MKKVFIIHGFEGAPNGGWRPWLMAELAKVDVYACSLAMPHPEKPISKNWLNEIARHVKESSGDEIYLIGHSLGVPAILHYLETVKKGIISGSVLVSGPAKNNGNKKLVSFFKKPFNFKKISKHGYFSVIHGDNDSLAPLDGAYELSEKLNASLVVIKNGGHLNSASGRTTLPEALSELTHMINKKTA